MSDEAQRSPFFGREGEVGDGERGTVSGLPIVLATALLSGTIISSCE